MLKIDLKKLFTAATIGRVLESAPPLRSTVQDEFFSEASRQQYELPMIPLAELSHVVQCVPVVSRSGQAVPLAGHDYDAQYIEPLPVGVRTGLRPEELNNLKLMNLGQQQAWAARKILLGRQTIKATVEALSAQAVYGGAIDYPLLADNGRYVRYKVDYGSTILEQEVAPEERWDQAGMSLAKVYLLLEEMDTRIDDAGYGGEKVVYAGRRAYAQLLVLVETNNQAKQAKVPATLEKDGSISIGGHTVRKMAETWQDPETGVAQRKVPDTEIRMVAKGHHAFWYAALDDLDAGLQALPMFLKPVEMQDPSEWRLIAMSKPLPAVAPRATCKAVVL